MESINVAKLDEEEEKAGMLEEYGMGFFENFEKSKGGFIFLSHSHEDIEKVRKIRNGLEDGGFEPLCFYLKCLTDDSEIEELIKREIDAREWFVFVNSENARKSKWVTIEREYITRTNRKKIINIDIDKEGAVSEVIKRITQKLRVYISYSYKDKALARRIKNKLEEKDYLAYFDDDVISTGYWMSQIMKKIEEASKEGCVLVLLTPEALKSEIVIREIEFAIHNNGNVVPVIVGDVQLTDRFEFLLYRIQHYRLSTNPTEKELEDLVEGMSRYILKG